MALVKRLSDWCEVVVHDMADPEVMSCARQLGISSVSAVVVDGHLARLLRGPRGPDEASLRAAEVGRRV